METASLLPRLVRARPGEQLIGCHRVDDRRHVDAARGSALAAIGEPIELTGGVSIGVDAQPAARLHRQAQEPLRWIEPLRPGVDLDRFVEADGPGEDDLRIEL